MQSPQPPSQPSVLPQFLGIVFPLAGFLIAIKSSWYAAAISGAVLILGAVVFLIVIAHRGSLSLGFALVALLSTLVGGGLCGAVISQWLSPQASGNPGPSTSSTSTVPTTNTGNVAHSASNGTGLETKSQPETQFLIKIKAVDSSHISGPTSVSIGGVSYPYSFNQACTPNGRSSTFSVAGYDTLTGKLGLDDKQGTTAAVRGYKSTIRIIKDGNRQLGDDMTVSIDKSADLSVKLEGATQITITCTITDQRSDFNSYYSVAFGDARLSK
ncbi:hypothetical protein AB0A74_09740 [Saccharothrix sp. NPDC042600]|uniref:hypothetical protein n=1 Tax=Saccharothrix TaxID=2071 RepID=UPI0033F43705|nr:hypothetical protein GCM10017745_35880 [Saccharothrix mutabilis subsp. capreolus]